MKRGFTLIELLVVVLIIGILSAVALPQYQKAVRKARMAEAFTLVKSAAQAVDAYIMATGEMPSDWNQLDIEIPGENGNWSGGPTKVTKTYNYTLFLNRVQAFGMNDDIPQLIYLSALADYAPNGNRFFCTVRKNSTADREGLCKSMAKAEAVTSPTDANYLWYPL